uniref:Uncharacterized protein n=2 Tax=Graphocephala atropunctata TaxID=36148 RepID=A0A1B6LMR7_9HEMI
MEVNQVVEAEAGAVTEAIPIKDEEPKKEGDAPERTDEEKKEKTETTTETEAQSTEPTSPAPAPVEPAPVSSPVPAPEPVAEPAPAPEPVAPIPEPAAPAPVETPAPEPVPEPIVEAAPTPAVVEATPEPVQEEVEVVAVAVEEAVEKVVVEAVPEAKVEELPPPLPASPPPTEAPPPTPVAIVPDVSLHVDSLVDTQETEVVGGGESMAEPVDVEPVLEDEKLDDAPLVNGISNHTHQFDEEISEKVELVTENFKTIVTESIISTQVTENSEDNSEQTASAAE